MKTVIFAWTHNFNIDDAHLQKYNFLNETSFFFGLGDLIRASIKLFVLSKTLDYRLIIDLQLHPVSQFLEKKSHEYSQHVLLNKNNIDYVCYGALSDYINSKDGIMYIFTNDFYEGEITDEIRDFIKNIFTPTIIFSKYIEQRISIIPYPFYDILHYRLNDDEFLKKKNTVDHSKILEHVKLNIESNDILITDTKSFKDLVFHNKLPVFMFETKICHLGLSTDPDAIRDTLFEFFLITKARKIRSYCKIHKMSGFVKWVSKIYDIPVSLI